MFSFSILMHVVCGYVCVCTDAYVSQWHVHNLSCEGHRLISGVFFNYSLSLFIKPGTLNQIQISQIASFPSQLVPKFSVSAF